MTSAHQGVPVADLPGSGSGGLFSSLFGGARSSAPVPPSTVGAAPSPPASIPAAAATNQANAGLDGWLLNNLFGRR